MTPANKKSAPRSFRGLSGEERRGERRKRLLEAGFELFGTRGHQAVTVREVCAQAKLTERYFYESFDNLEALFKTIYNQVHIELKQATFGALARAPRTPDDLAEASLRAFFTFVHEDPRRGQILLVDATGMGERMLAQAEGAIKDYVDLTRSMILMLYPNMQQEMRVDPSYLAQGMVGSLIFQFWRWAAEGFQTPIDDVVRTAMILHRALSAYATTAQREVAEAAKVGHVKTSDAG